jgi:hypothetical protein
LVFDKSHSSAAVTILAKVLIQIVSTGPDSTMSKGQKDNVTFSLTEDGMDGGRSGLQPIICLVNASKSQWRQFGVTKSL